MHRSDQRHWCNVPVPGQQNVQRPWHRAVRRFLQLHQLCDRHRPHLHRVLGQRNVLHFWSCSIQRILHLRRRVHWRQLRNCWCWLQHEHAAVPRYRRGCCKGVAPEDSPCLQWDSSGCRVRCVPQMTCSSDRTAFGDLPPAAHVWAWLSVGFKTFDLSTN